MDERYYTEEINYLLDLSEAFSRRHPEKAQMLHLKDARSREPNVERLYESFAFLASRIRKRLDDDFSPIADGLFSFVWPGYINFLPSCCLLELSSSNDINPEVVTVPKGALIESDALDENIRCRFSTTQESVILPVSISDVSAESKGSISILTMTFDIHKDADRSELAKHPFKIHIVDEFLSSCQLYDLLLGRTGGQPNVSTISMTASTAENSPVGSWKLGPDAIAPLGLTQDELLLPSKPSNFWRFELLRDFFSFPEKFLGFELDVLRRLTDPDIGQFQLVFTIEREWPSNLKLSKDQFRLNTVPMINLYAKEAVPIRLTDSIRDFPIQASATHPEYFQVFSVDKVDSVEGGKNTRNIYEPFYSLNAHFSEDQKGARKYRLERVKAPWGDYETHIRFYKYVEDDEFQTEEIVSMSVTCANGRLANKLKTNQIHNIISGIPVGTKARNIGQPTPFYLPNLDEVSKWRWLSHAALNHTSLQSSGRFKTMLLLHDFTAAEANRRKMDGITSVDIKPTRVFSKGMLVPSIAVNLTLQEEKFVHLGEIQLFTRVLSVFLASYGSLNSFIQLSVTTEPSNQKITFDPVPGDNLGL